MADDGIYTKNADIAALAGINAGTTAVSTAVTDVYVLNVEAIIDVATGFDWSSAYTAGILDVTLRNALTMAGASRCAMIVVIADPRGYSARERETTLDLLNSLYDEAIKIILDKDGAALMKGET